MITTLLAIFMGSTINSGLNTGAATHNVTSPDIDGI